MDDSSWSLWYCDAGTWDGVLASNWLATRFVPDYGLTSYPLSGNSWNSYTPRPQYFPYSIVCVPIKSSLWWPPNNWRRLTSSSSECICSYCICFAVLAEHAALWSAWAHHIMSFRLGGTDSQDSHSSLNPRIGHGDSLKLVLARMHRRISSGSRPLKL